jgi:integrase
MTHRRKLAKTRNATSLGNEVGRCRVILQYAFGNGLVKHPPRFGDFKRPGKSVLRRKRAEAEPRMFTAEQVKQILDVACPQMRAMVLLACNAGLGNSDVGRMRKSSIDFETSWVSYARPKTGIPGRFKLWPETLQAVRDAMEVRPTPKDPKDSDLVFVTRTGRPWHQEDSKHCPISLQFGKLVRGQGFYRTGLSFYAMRHTFQSVADEVGDYIATRMVMGHATDSDMSGTYREKFDDRRIERVTDHVRTWLFGGRDDG